MDEGGQKNDFIDDYISFDYFIYDLSNHVR